MRLHMVGRNCQASDIDTGDVARRFMTWLIDDANTVLTEIIETWLWLPGDSGGLGALAESVWDLAVLRAEVIASWRPDPGNAEGVAVR